MCEYSGRKGNYRVARIRHDSQLLRQQRRNP
jgi:hypothetical protein